MTDRLIATNLKSVIPYRIRFYARYALEFPESIRRAPRHDNAFSTHIPVLTAIGRIMPIRRILEFGSGTISTMHFLNRRVFPYVEAVVSYENDYDWYQVVNSQTTDPRLKLDFVPEDMHTVVSSVALKDFDLIFVDDSKSAEQRSQTIMHLAARKHEVTGLVAIHDFEQRAYREAASEFTYSKRFRAFNPEVGLVWSSDDIKPSLFQRVNRIIKTHAQQIEPDDVEAWLHIFNTNRQ